MNRYYILLFIQLSVVSCQNPERSPAYQQTQATSEIIKAKTPIDLPATGQTEKDRLITPGTSIGNTKLNESLQQIIKQLGKPDAGDAAMGKSVSVWYTNHDTSSNSVSIYATTQMGIEDTSRIKMIRITSSWFMTKDGVHTGMSLARLRESYDFTSQQGFTEKEQQYIVYETEKGIAFEVNKQNKCTAIIVHETKGKVNDHYLMFHSY